MNSEISTLKDEEVANLYKRDRKTSDKMICRTSDHEPGGQTAAMVW
jgi:hypothetical protein